MDGNEGIWEQIRNKKPIILNGKITAEDIEKIKKQMDLACERDSETKRNRIKKSEENFKHLKNRAKELNKEIPMELLFYSCNPYYTVSVGGWFFEKYKEWL